MILRIPRLFQWKKLLFTLTITLISFSFCASQSEFEKITFKEFFERIEEELSPRVTFKDIIIIDNYSNADTLTINKNLILENVVFNPFQSFKGITFNKSVEFINSGMLEFTNCTFKGSVKILSNDENNFDFSQDNTIEMLKGRYFIFFDNCSFGNTVNLYIDGGILKATSAVDIRNCDFNFNYDYTWKMQNIDEFTLSDCNVNLSKKDFNLSIFKSESIEIKRNTFTSQKSRFTIENHGRLSIGKNNFNSPIFLDIPILKKHDYINWEFLSGNTYEFNNYTQYLNDKDLLLKTMISAKQDSFEKVYIDSFINQYIIEDQEYFNRETSFLGKFRDHYRDEHNRAWSNMAYRDLKDLETKRYKYLYKTEKSFENYFQVKINQFLKLFSEYGTRPAKAIIISIYVIFFFAIFYFFFPNSWDDKDRRRIMDRMLFFTKYFKVKEGMKEVFEEQNKSKIMVYDEFINYINDSKKEVPPYFTALSRPIYFFSVINYKVRGKILKRADILEGKWSDLKPRRKILTSVIMAFWLVAILSYDLFVKFINALMLSINTFSTLGFGEIPIKGIPRYLAILQGFLGWFMLSIFSVSLISQMLN